MEIKNTGWPYRADVVIQINPAKRNKVIKTFVLVGVILIATIFTMQDNGYFMQWAKRQDQLIEKEKIQPIMQKLASDGKQDAIIWLARNNLETKSEKLEELVVTGNTRAMMALAAQKWNAKDYAAAKQLILTAAENGNDEAIKVKLSQPEFFE